MSTKERDKFMTRLDRDRRDGLVDLKFFFKPDRPLEPEDIFGAMNEVEDAIRAGQCTRHTAWDHNTPA